MNCATDVTIALLFTTMSMNFSCTIKMITVTSVPISDFINHACYDLSLFDIDVCRKSHSFMTLHLITYIRLWLYCTCYMLPNTHLILYYLILYI